MLEQEQPAVIDLLAVLPNPKEYEEIDADFGWKSFVGLEAAVDEALPKLRDIAGDCPACILAALRQKGIPVPIAKSFNFKAECESIWADINERWK